MGDLKDEKDPADNISTKNETPKAQITQQPSEEIFKIPLENSEEKVEKLYESIEPENDIKCVKEEKKEVKAEKNYAKPPIEGENTIDKEKLLVNKEESKLKMSDEKIVEKPIKKVSDSVPCCPISREKIIRNQSDIFSLKDISTTLQTSIFSVNGSPSRRVFRKQEPAGHVFQRNEDRSSDKTTVPKANRITRENYNDEKRPSSSYRNPLTGTGLSSNDEYKSKGIKRKDGNPLLGLGYDAEVSSTASQHRVPPGGFSHKLW